MMRNGTSLTLIAVGAILAFAVHLHLQVFSFFTVGIILMLVGAIGPLVTRSSLGRRGVTVAVPSLGQPAAADPAPADADAVDTSAVDPAANEARPLPEARTSDSEWSSPRPGLRAI